MTKPSPIALLRYSFVVLFLWFGYEQVTDAHAWVGFLPDWAVQLPLSSQMLVVLNGWFEIVCALALLVGIFVRPVAALLALHLFGIAIITGGAIGMRDAVLAMIGVTLACADVDRYTLDFKRNK